MNILIIDNYDSFTYNLVQLVRTVTGTEPVVRRNDCFTLEEVALFDKILLSPGPGLPADAGLLLAVIQRYAATKSILGVCLGHQAIAEAFGGRLARLDEVCHGFASDIQIVAGDALFYSLPLQFPVGRYHSWVVATDVLPESLRVTAVTASGTIMALRHKEYDVCGVQFHPESILTGNGKIMIENWINTPLC